MVFKMEGKLVIIKWRENKLVLGFHHPFNLVRGSVLASSGSSLLPIAVVGDRTVWSSVQRQLPLNQLIIGIGVAFYVDV
jgi:hypothetical protein